MDLLVDELAQRSVDEAMGRLGSKGWTEIAQGDWAWVLAHPSEPVVARLTPFDPAYLMFAEDCRSGPRNRWLPVMHRLVRLKGDGYAVFMERLWPADEGVAASLCAALGIPNDCGYSAAEAQPLPIDDGDFDEVRVRISNLLRRGAARYRLWGGCDVRPGNVMQDAAGQLKLVDPIFLAGPRLVAAIRTRSAADLADFSVAQLTAFLRIPAFSPARASASSVEELLEAVGQL